MVMVKFCNGTWTYVFLTDVGYEIASSSGKYTIPHPKFPKWRVVFSHRSGLKRCVLPFLLHVDVSKNMGKPPNHPF